MSRPAKSPAAFAFGAAVFLLALAPAARADTSGPTRRSDLLVEVDPATFALGGFSAHVRLRPALLPGWSVGAGVYAMDLPSPLVDLDPANRAEGWSVRIRLGAAVFVDRFLGDAPDGPFAGVELGLQRIRLENDRLGPGSAQYTAMLLMPRGGYLWRPFDSGFYVMPWGGIGLAVKTAGSTQVAGGSYHVPPVPLFATLHLGWRL